MTAALEVWGGPECTVNRVGDLWRDQFEASGHNDRVDDLDRFAELGLRTLRYPILWEKTEVAPGVFDWTWADARMARLRTLGIRPIVGLVHHGSGPAWTNLLDEGFSDGLAVFAAAVAERYPWVTDWTPVNEPLTTARFSALYGHWYPHAASEQLFWTALLNQIDGVRNAMAAIRRVIPAAQLVQTEDFGTTFGTEPCRDQIRHENIRRLATWDLLDGRVLPDHPLYLHIAAFGLATRLAEIAAAPCPANVIGLNHYATSDRYLDHRLERYATHLHGGNGVLAYADIEAVRVLEDDEARGWKPLLHRLWSRYATPIAITECHLGCSTDEQIRWLSDCWDAAGEARAEGVPVLAVTVWALLGSYDWNSLLTLDDKAYEPGAFDLATGEPRLTLLGDAVRQLALEGSISDEMHRSNCAPEGWWLRSDRFVYPGARTPCSSPPKGSSQAL